MINVTAPYFELRVAVRRLLKSKVFLVATAGTLALGLGVAASSLTLIRGVLLRPLPFPDADSIVLIHHSALLRRMNVGQSSGHVFSAYDDANTKLVELAAYRRLVVTLTDGDEPMQIPAGIVTPNFFTVFRVDPQLGRTFIQGPENAGTVVISDRLWKTRYSEDPDIVGKQIRIGSSSRQVVGVAPPELQFPDRETGLWYPMRDPRSSNSPITFQSFRILARLSDASAIDEVRSALQVRLDALAESVGGADAAFLRDLRVVLTPLKQSLLGSLGEALWVVALSLVLLIVVIAVTVAHLFLRRFAASERSIAVREALGASHADIRRYWITEVAVVAALGGIGGALITGLLLGVRFGFSPAEIPQIEEISLDVLSAGFVVIGLAVLIFVALAAFELGRRGFGSVRAARLGRTAQARPARRRWGRLMIGAHVTISVLLLLFTVNATRSFVQLLQIDLGFDATDVFSFDVDLPVQDYLSYPSGELFQRRVLSLLDEEPDIVSAGAITYIPLTPVPDEYMLQVFAGERSDDPGVANSSAAATIFVATPSYFETMRIPLVAGRVFESADIGAGAVPALIDKSLAERFVGTPENAIGLSLHDETGLVSATVVGIVGDTVGRQLSFDPQDAIYLPLLETSVENDNLFSTTYLTTVVRVDPVMGSNRSLSERVQATVSAVDSQLASVSVTPVIEYVDRHTANARLATLLLSICAGMSILLTAGGIYAIIAVGVAERGAELALRVALGARTVDIYRLVARELGAVVVPGLALGALGYLFLERYLSNVLLGAAPIDLAMLLLVLVVILSVAAAACVPALMQIRHVEPGRLLTLS